MKKVSFRDWRKSGTEAGAIEEMANIAKKRMNKFFIFGWLIAIALVVLGTILGTILHNISAEVGMIARMSLLVLGGVWLWICMALTSVSYDCWKLAEKGSAPNFALARIIFRLPGAFIAVIAFEKIFYFFRLEVIIAGWSKYKEYLN